MKQSRTNGIMMTKASGFTLIELLVTISIIAIIVGFAVPGFQPWIAKTRVEGAGDALLSSLRLARSEAVKRNGLVYIYPQDSDDWSLGWAVTSDVAKGYSACILDGTNCFLVQAPFSSLDIDDAPPSVRYTGGGRLVTGDSACFDLSDTNAHYERTLSVAVTPSGRSRLEVDDDGGCA